MEHNACCCCIWCRLDQNAFYCRDQRGLDHYEKGFSVGVFRDVQIQILVCGLRTGDAEESHEGCSEVAKVVRGLVVK